MDECKLNVYGCFNRLIGNVHFVMNVESFVKRQRAIAHFPLSAQRSRPKTTNRIAVDRIPIKHAPVEY
jgi:hypothetical protein